MTSPQFMPNDLKQPPVVVAQNLLWQTLPGMIMMLLRGMRYGCR
jgi:hypothetical protein